VESFAGGRGVESFAGGRDVESFAGGRRIGEIIQRSIKNIGRKYKTKRHLYKHLKEMIKSYMLLGDVTLPIDNTVLL
jgi:hypothetical protein